LKRLLFLILLGALGAFFVRTFVIEGIYLKTDSMAPTLREGRHIFVNKFAYVFKRPKRGDIIMFPDSQTEGKDLIKRVIAIEGDVLGIYKKQVILNGQPLKEKYIQHLRADTLLEGDTFDPILIPKNHVFVMGDNRDFSRDSRDWIYGKVWKPFLPVKKIKGRVMTDK